MPYFHQAKSQGFVGEDAYAMRSRLQFEKAHGLNAIHIGGNKHITRYHWDKKKKKWVPATVKFNPDKMRTKFRVN